jgi:microcystin degradation protein MlrC
MRIAIGQLWQETNTFNPLRTTRDDFEQFGVVRGAELIERMAETNELGGFIQSLRAWPQPPEIVPLVRLPAWPSGLATAETFDWLRDELLAAVRAALPLHALLLALHGAMVAEGHPDVEGEIVAALRAIVGPAVPIVATLDLHCSLTRRLVAATDALVLYHTAPHTDVYETGVRGAAVLRRMLVEGARPVTAWVRVPAVFPAERANTSDPASVSHAFHHRLVALERDPRVLSAGLATVQPWLDIPELASAALIVTNGQADLAARECESLAADVWSRRHDYLPELTPLEEAVRLAHQRRDGLTVLSDSADATTSGAPGDSTWLLAEFLKYDWPGLALLPMVSPEGVAACQAAGIGAELTLSLGGVRDTRFSRPVSVTGHVERLFDARFILQGHLARNMPIDMGRSAVLRQGNIGLVLTSRTGPHFAPELFRAAGYDPFAAQALVAKSPCGFRAVYAARAAAIHVVQAPGCAPSDFWNYEYRHRPRPLWPWDDLPDWRPRAEVFPAVVGSGGAG